MVFREIVSYIKGSSEELESENKELQTFTEQMASTHSRLTQGVIELQNKQATMVAQEVHEEALAEIEQPKEDQLRMVRKWEGGGVGWGCSWGGCMCVTCVCM